MKPEDTALQEKLAVAEIKVREAHAKLTEFAESADVMLAELQEPADEQQEDEDGERVEVDVAAVEQDVARARDAAGEQRQRDRHVQVDGAEPQCRQR